MHSEVRNLFNSFDYVLLRHGCMHHPQAKSYSACTFWSSSKYMLCTCLIAGVCVMVERCAFLTRCTTLSYCRRGTVAVRQSLPALVRSPIPAHAKTYRFSTQDFCLRPQRTNKCCIQRDTCRWEVEFKAQQSDEGSCASVDSSNGSF